MSLISILACCVNSSIEEQPGDKGKSQNISARDVKAIELSTN